MTPTAIKTLPATLPEPSSMNRGPRTGVTGAVSQSDWDVCKWVGRILGVGSCASDLGCRIGGGGGKKI